MLKFSFEQQIEDKVISFLSFWVLLFAISPFSHLPWGSGYRYLVYVGFPGTLLVIFIERTNLTFFKEGLSHFVKFIEPFLPFLIFFTLIRVYFFDSFFDSEVNFGVINLTILLNTAIFSILAYFRVNIRKEYFFYACAISSCIFVIDIFWVSALNGVSIWSVRQYVSPYPTIYGKCIALIGGLTIIGAFVCKRLLFGTRIAFIVVGNLCFFVSIGVLLVRATLCIPFFTLLCLALLLRGSHKKLIFAGVVVLTLLSIVLLVFTPLGTRLERGCNETISTVVDKKTTTVITKIIENKLLTSDEEEVKKKLNTSMGGRVAVWNLAKNAEFNPIIGSGLGKPEYFIDVTKLFNYSKDYLPHFHSDYVQCYVVGGLVLLVSIVVTQFLLFRRALQNPILLFLWLSMISFGLMDLGFLDAKTFTCFLGAWMIVSLWDVLKDRNTKAIKDLYDP